MTRPVWPKVGRPASEIDVDPGASLLTKIARDVEAHAARALRGRGLVKHDEPVRVDRSWSSSAVAQVWQSDTGDGVDVYCAIGDPQARALLEIVLGGPGAAKMTALERGIVRETVERLLSSCGRLWDERTPTTLPAGTVWICRLNVAAAVEPKYRTRNEVTAELTLCTAAVDEAPVPVASRVDLRAVPLTLTATLPSAGVRVADVLAWRPGAVVALAGDPETHVGLSAGGLRVAGGRLGAHRGRRAILIGTQGAR